MVFSKPWVFQVILETRFNTQVLRLAQVTTNKALLSKSLGAFALKLLRLISALWASGVKEMSSTKIMLMA
ncbi:MAG: hypothetical protein VR73_08405 [Gammaproteobacteria bacterium BRH_c0]|nr:MAG: hypothetical protein VR73_08405 [Gammaproteobacteria bacterium BRH_c0]